MAAIQSPTTSQIVKLLASCNQPTRTKAVRLLLKWLPHQTSSSPSDDELIKIWKGLFFCVWHADKVPYQTDLINKLSSLLETCHFDLALRYFECFLITLRREWSGIDYLRLDKFYLMIRRFMLKSFSVLKKKDWNVEFVSRFVNVLEKKLFFAEDKFMANGVLYHVTELFLDELGKSPTVKKEAFEMFMMLFLSVLEKSTERVLVGKIKVDVFERILYDGFKYLTGDKSEEVDKFGKFVLVLGFSDKLFKSASDEGTVQGSRKVLFELQKKFLKLEKEFEKSKIQISFDNLGNSNEVEKETVSSDGGLDVRPLKKRKKEKKSSDLKKKKTASGVTNEENVVETEGKSSKKKKTKLTASSVDSIDNVNNGTVNGKNVSEKKSKSSKKKKAILESSIESNENVSGKKSKSSKSKKKNVLESSIESNDNVSDLAISEEKASLNGTGDNDMLDFDESVISNLQKQFEKIAAEEGMKTSPIDNKKKRKRVKSAGKIVTPSNKNENSGGKSGEKSGKKVRFSMKNNLVWKPQTPMPPQSLRLPPSAAPRGSALKKGVPPGPIKESPATIKKIKARGSSVKKTMKSTLMVSPAVKRLRKLQILSP